MFQTVWLVTAAAHAESFIVTTEEDEPDAAPGDGTCATAAERCSLRAAVEEANALPGLDRIYLSTLASRFLLQNGPLVLSGELEISGREARFAVIDAGGASRVIELVPRDGEPVSARLAGVTLDNGYAGPADPNGGAVSIADPASSLVLERSLVSNSRAVGSGGGIYNAGSLELRRSALQNNSSGLEPESDPAASGGGLYSAGLSVLENSSLDDNNARHGGGLANASGRVELTNVTIGRNEAEERGGALLNASGATATLAFCTLVYNLAGIDDGTTLRPGQGGGVYNLGTLQLTATIVAQNRDLQLVDSTNHAPDCVSVAPARLRSRGALVLGVVTERCEHTAQPSDLRGSVPAPLDPGLDDSYQSREFEVSYGYVPEADSVALEAVTNPALCIARDQWSRPRPRSASGGPGARCDSGAVEVTNDTARRNVMMLVGDRTLSPTDLVLMLELFNLGFDVFDEVLEEEVNPEVLSRDMTLISESVVSTRLPSWLFAMEKPILTLEPRSLDELGMTRDGWGVAQGAATAARSVRVVGGSPIDSGLRGWTQVVERPARLGWGVPATDDAFVTARLLWTPRRATVFGYPAGARLAGGVRAPAARVAFFAATGTPEVMTDDGWRLFSATLDYLVPPL